MYFQLLVVVHAETYQYTMGVDTDDEFLFCQSPDDSVQLSDIHWRRQDRIGFFPNPLDISRLGYLLKYTNTHPMECFDTESDNTIVSVQLNVQGKICDFRIVHYIIVYLFKTNSTGPPILTLYKNSYTTFSLLPPAVNRVDILILTQNVTLSVNLVGRWQTPDGSYVNSDFISIPTLYVSHAGLYKFYVTNWEGNLELAIQIDISPVGKFGVEIHFPLIIQ